MKIGGLGRSGTWDDEFQLNSVGRVKRVDTRFQGEVGPGITRLPGNIYRGGKAIVTGDAGRAIGNRAIAIAESGSGREFDFSGDQIDLFYRQGLAGELTGANTLAEGVTGAELTTGEAIEGFDRAERVFSGTGQVLLSATGTAATVGKGIKAVHVARTGTSVASAEALNTSVILNPTRSAAFQKAASPVAAATKKVVQALPSSVRKAGTAGADVLTTDVRELVKRSPRTPDLPGIADPLETWTVDIIPDNQLVSQFDTSSVSRIDFTERGRHGGKLYGAERLDVLRSYLKRHGVDLVLDDPEMVKIEKIGFKADGTKMYLQSDVTHYEVMHELGHYVHYRRIGKEAYKALPRPTAPEQAVYDLLRGNERRWERQLNLMERLDAQLKVERDGGTAW